MKKFMVVLTVLAFVLATAAWAAPKSYQVTGPVLEIKGDVIVVDKNGEKWEVAKDAATKISGDLKVGARVTIEYTMTAKKVEVKAPPAKADPKPAPRKP
jgi:hypothetical protein